MNSSSENTRKRKAKAPLLLRIIEDTLGVLTFFAIIVRGALELSEPLAEWFYMNVTRHFQTFAASVTSPLPFSLAETLVLALPAAVILSLVGFIVFAVSGNRRGARTLLSLILSAVFYCTITYIVGLSALYCRPSLSSMSHIPDEAVSAKEIRQALEIMSERIDECVDGKSFFFDQNGGSVCPYSFDELSEKIDAAYEKFAVGNNYITPIRSRAKRIAVSELMTYTHISGMYTPYTGETNINTNYPDFVITSTVAHEKAHRSGIAPEDEANILAMLVLIGSGDDYLEYCGYMSVFYDVLGAYYDAAADGEYAEFITTELPNAVITEQNAYSLFFAPYRTSAVSAAADAVNDTYLKLNGESDGIKSYGMTVNMTVKALTSPDTDFGRP